MLTDLEDHSGLIRENIARNGLASRVDAATLDWAADGAECAGLPLTSFDLILATDCAYHPRLHAPLIKVLAACLRDGNRAILGVTRSDTSTAFFDRLDEAGLDFRFLRRPRDSNFALLDITKRPGFFGASLGGPEAT